MNTQHIRDFIKVLDKTRDKLIDEFNDITSRMQTYDVSAFNSELFSEFQYYSLRYFDEEKFKKSIKIAHDVDLDEPIAKEMAFDSVYYYSHAFISLEALKDYIILNGITTEVDNEGMVYDS